MPGKPDTAQDSPNARPSTNASPRVVKANHGGFVVVDVPGKPGTHKTYPRSVAPPST